MTFSVFKVKNGWIVQTYGGSTGFNGNDHSEYSKTFVFTNVREMAQFLNARVNVK